MKREILFRGKKLYDGSWEYGFLSWSDTPRGRSYFVNNNIVEPETVGQFTGMTDKTGKKIFEGDIIKWIDSDGNNRIDKVLFSNGGFHLCNIYYNIGGYKGNSLEVIGNIHDNKELLK